MFRVLVGVLVGSCLVGAELYKFSDAYIDQINKDADTWTAGRNFPSDLNETYLRTFLIGDAEHYDRFEWPTAAERKVSDPEYSDSIPDSFDARERWRQCPSIGEIPDTGACSAPHIFAVVAAFRDRLCIKGLHDQPLSTEYVASCCRRCRYEENKTCSHGSLFKTWEFLRWRGVVSGGRFGDPSGCQPSSIQPCSHFGTDPALPSCESQSLPKLKCHTRCMSSQYGRSFFQDKHKSTPGYWVDDKEDAIKKEILAYGPVTAAFILHDDFYHYKNGVYKHSSASRLEQFLMSAKLIGWGMEKGIPYWLLINPWGAHWGDRGTFKILRGKDECALEYLVAAGKAKN